MSVKIPAVAAALFFLATASQATIFTVNSTADDGSVGTLRWAILENNITPAGNTIQVVPTSSPFVIKLNSFLPPITGPAVVTGAPGVVIDASNFIDGNNQNSCPGTTGGFGINVRSVYGPGLSVVDSGNVEISNFEIRNICIGVLLLRSHDNHVHHNTIHNTSGAAGIIVTGDDGTPAGGSTTGLSTRNLIEHNLVYETGDGLECTRGTTFSTYQFNTLIEFRDRGTNAPYSQGIECAGSGNNNNVIQYNMIKGYSDGLQLNTASNLTVLGNTIAGTTYGITTSGTNVLITNNLIAANRMGIGPTGNTSSVTITQNKIYSNGRPILSLSNSAGGTTNPNSPALLGIDFGINGVTPNDLAVNCADGFPDCTAPQNFPVLSPSSSWTASGITLNGNLPSRPNATFTIEFFANHSLNAAGFGEGEQYLGSLNVTTDSTGNVAFAFTAPPDPLGDGSTSAYFTATATNSTGQTSEFSQALQLTQGAAPAVDFQ
jgi:3-dehydroshikimate dehydratase